MKNFFRFNSAFTLAEILIVLGIIGIVSALTIPNLLQKNYENQVVSTLQKTQAILSQAIKMAEEEYGEAPTWIDSKMTNQQKANAIATKLKPFLKIAVDCGVGGKKGVCAPNVDYKLLNNGKHSNYNDTKMHYAVKLINGTSIWWRGYATTDEYNKKFYISFFVDTNGVNPPNTVGKDLFELLYYNGSIIPDGLPGTLSEVTTCSLKSTGWGCPYYILTNKNMKYLHE
jgi:prepilin-type N-terminal cleavage/methylation domain-containing protein